MFRSRVEGGGGVEEGTAAFPATAKAGTPSLSPPSPHIEPWQRLQSGEGWRRRAWKPVPCGLLTVQRPPLRLGSPRGWAPNYLLPRSYHRATKKQFPPPATESTNWSWLPGPGVPRLPTPRELPSDPTPQLRALSRRPPEAVQFSDHGHNFHQQDQSLRDARVNHAPGLSASPTPASSSNWFPSRTPPFPVLSVQRGPGRSRFVVSKRG